MVIRSAKVFDVILSKVSLKGSAKGADLNLAKINKRI